MKLLVLKRGLFEMSILFYCLISRIQDSSVSGWLSNFSPTSSKACTNSSECLSSSGEICFQMYEGCPKAQCMCQQHSRLITSDDEIAKCVPMSLGLGPCSSESMCRNGMTCKGGICRCVNGKMTPDRLQCLQHNARLLGDRCSPKENTCYQKAASGYTAGDVTCSSIGVCACTEGHRTEELSCRRRKVYEYGCRKSYHCEGGAVCSKGQCVCPDGYSAPANPNAGFKCFRNGATTNVPLGSECDEINERLYCATNLVCHRCASEQVYHCVRFVLANDFNRFGSSGGAPSSSSFVERTSSSSSSLSIIISISVIIFKSLLINKVFIER